MCGLFGAVGRNINVHAVRTLALLNEKRGRDSAGFFAADGNWYKCGPIAISDWMKCPKLRNTLEIMSLTGALCGHTRGATRGNAVTDNAHPFTYAYGLEKCDDLRGHRILLSHNGVVSSPANYRVDSMFMADLLSQGEPGDYQKSLGDVEGWYVLTWLDEREEAIYFLNWQGQLSFVAMGKTIYYSSSAMDLEIALGCPPTKITKDDGEIWRWDLKKQKMQPMKKFTGKKRTYTHFGANSRTSYYDDWDDTEPTGGITVTKTGVIVANCRGCYYAKLKDQEKWRRMAPGLEHGRFFWPPKREEVIADIDKDSPLLRWDGTPVDESSLFRSRKKKKAKEEDTVLEDSEQGVIVNDTPGVQDKGTKTITTTQQATPQQEQALKDLLAGMESPHALVKADVAQRMEQAKKDDTVQKALELQEQIDRRQNNSRYEEGEDRADPTAVHQAAVRRIIEVEYQQMKAAGYSEEQIDKELFMRGFYDELEDWHKMNPEKLREMFEDEDLHILP